MKNIASKYVPYACLLVLLVSHQLCAQTITGKDGDNTHVWKKYICLEKYLVPFWKADTVYDEIIQPIKVGGQAEGALLFKAHKILSVRSSDLIKQYAEGKDWNYKDGKIMLTPNSAIPFIAIEDLVFSAEKPGLSMTGKTPGTFVLFSESNYLTARQISVTYIPRSGNKWSGPIPVFAKKTLPGTIAKLKHKQALKIVFFGNSIETGCNSSGFMNQSPYMPSWPELIVYDLKQHYTGQIDFNNQSVGGKIAQWGREVVDTTVVPQNPDIVVVGFGMNDGAFGIPVQQYLDNIKAIMDAVTAKNPKAEFVLIATMLANPDAVQNNMQGTYKVGLEKLSKIGVVVADLTGVHTELLRYKSYQDMTGNNVNHPNDYLARWYAQYISGLLIDR